MSRIGLTQWGLLGLAGWIPAIRPMEAVGVATGPRVGLRPDAGRRRVHAGTGLLLALGLVLARTT